MEQPAKKLDVQNSCTADSPAQAIRAELYGTSIAVAEGIKVDSRSPVCELARRLIAAGHDPESCLECYRRNESTGHYRLSLTGRLDWFAARHFTEGVQSIHAVQYTPPAACSGRPEHEPPRVKYGAPGAVGTPHGAEHPTAPDAALSGKGSEQESAEDYKHVLARAGDGWRVSLCPEPPQFLLQRRTGRTWKVVAFCTTRAAVIRESRARIGPLRDDAEAALAGLPEYVSHFKKAAAPEGERGRLNEGVDVIHTNSTADQE